MLLALSALTGCATRQAPGQGYGADYTPVIDLQGVNRDVYATDLDACRRAARNIDASQATMEGALGGAILGALVSGALGGGRQTTMDSANIGALSGIGRASSDAMAGQKRIVINCMVGRGYRALEVTPALGSYQQPATRAYSTAPAGLGQPAQQPRNGAAAPTIAPAAQIGQFSHQAERIPEARACAAMPQASLVTKGPGFELFAVACRNSDTLMVRCEMGNCRAMR